MENKLSCEVVEDLLPNYIEHLTQEKTNQLIKEHLSTCKHCQSLYESMTSPSIETSNIENESTDYLRKINKKRFQARFMIIGLICLCLGLVFLANREQIPFDKSTTIHNMDINDDLFIDDIEVQGNYSFTKFNQNGNHYSAYGFQFGKNENVVTTLHLEIPRQEVTKVYFVDDYPIIVSGTIDEGMIWPTFIISNECFTQTNNNQAMITGIFHILGLMGVDDLSISFSKELYGSNSYNFEFQGHTFSDQDKIFIAQLLYNYSNTNSLTFWDKDENKNYIPTIITKDNIELFKINELDNFEEFLNFYHHFMGE